MRIFGKPYPIDGLALTITLGLTGALIARFIGAPLPWLIGSVVAVGILTISGIEPYGLKICFPSELRTMAIPVIGVAIGGAFTPALLNESAAWWPSLLAMFVFVPAAHFGGYTLYRRAGGFDPVTAWYGAMPGGFVEAVILGEERGAHLGLLTGLQFLRLILCMLLVPLGFSLLQGAPVGSAAGVQIPGGESPLTLPDTAVLVICGVSGYLVYRRLRLPAGMVTGPMLLSGAAHLAGIVEGHPPFWLIEATQFVIGISLGSRFAGVTRRDLWQAFRAVMIMVLAMLAGAAVLGMVLGDMVDESAAAIVLAFAPGGLVEMSLVAISLGVSTVYVTAHHVLRIVLAVILARAFGSSILDDRGSAN